MNALVQAPAARELRDTTALTPVRIETLISVIKLRPRLPHETIRDIFADPAIPKNVPVLCLVDGNPVLRKNGGWDAIPPPKSEVAFQIMPGSGGSNDIIRLVATLALIIVSAAVFGPTGAVASSLAVEGTFITAQFVSTVLVAASVVGGSLILNALLPPDTPGPGPGNPSPTYSLSPQGNQARLGAPIPVGYGRRKFTPDFAAPPYVEYEANQQYVCGLLCLGFGEYDPEQINIGKTAAWKDGSNTGNFVAVEFEFLAPGEVPTLYPAPTVTSPEVSGQELRNLRLTGLMQFVAVDGIFTNAGAPENDNIAMFTNMAPGDAITISGTASNNGARTIVDALAGGHTLLVTGGALVNETATATIQTTNWVGPFPVTSPKYVCDEIVVDFAFPKGLYYAGDDGKLQHVVVIIAVEAREIDADGDPLGDWIRLGTLTYRHSINTPQRYTEKFQVTPGRYEVRCQRTEKKSYDPRHASDLVWIGLKGRIPFSGVYGRGDVSLLAYRMKATNQLSVASSREISVIQTRKIPTWNGTGWTDNTATRSIAWAAADMLRNTVYGAGIDDEDIDLDTLITLDETWEVRGDTADGVFDQTETVWDGLSELLKAGRTQPLMLGGKVTFARDQPRDLPKGFFSPRNTLKGSFSSTAIFYDENTPDDVIYEYWDELTWTRKEVQCTLPGSISAKPGRITNRFVANRSQGWREGIYHAAVNANRRTLASLSTEMEGRLLIRGDQAVIANDMMQWNESGDIEALDHGTTLMLSEPATWGDNNYILLRRQNGKTWGPVKVTRGDDDDVAVLDADSLADAETLHGAAIETVISDDLLNRPTHFQFGDAVTAFRKFLVLSGKVVDQEQVQLAFVNDDEAVYLADADGPPEEEDPDVGAPGAPGTPATLNLVYVSGTDPVTISATWTAVPFATTYDVETSSDDVHWSEPTNVAALTTNLTVTAGLIYVRVRAVT